MEYSGYNEVHTYYSRTLKSQNRVYILGQWKWNLTLSWLTNWKKKKKRQYNSISNNFDRKPTYLELTPKN